MVAQKVKPNLQTFNTILKCLQRFHLFARLPALQTLREMKAIGIGEYVFWCPSLQPEMMLTGVFRSRQAEKGLGFICHLHNTLGIYFPPFRTLIHMYLLWLERLFVLDSKLQYSFSILGTLVWIS